MIRRSVVHAGREDVEEQLATLAVEGTKPTSPNRVITYSDRMLTMSGIRNS